MNIKKAASALNQNQKQIKAALQGASVTFASVEKSLGRAQFLLQIFTEKGIKSVTGTPRGLFTAGTMRIAAGQIAIVEGSEKLGFEIVARIDDLSDAQKLVKLGALPAEILAAAQVAGSKSGVAAAVEDDGLFDYSEAQEGAVEPSLKGGVKGARKQQESLAAAAALADRLGSCFAGGRSVHLESAADLSVFVGCDDSTPKKKKARAKSPPAAPVKSAAPEERVALDFGSALWSAGADEPVFKPVALAAAPDCWEDDAVEVDIDAI
jgi:hypothetical protein